MVKSAGLVKEIVVTEKNKMGILANISKILADHGINIEGVAGYAANNEANIMLVAEDNTRALDAIKKAGYKQVRESEVIEVVLTNKQGALKTITAKLVAGGIDIKYTYGTICSTGCPAKIIISTSNNEKALTLLKQ